MTSAFRDFDAAFEEKRREREKNRPRFKLGNKEYILPASLPAAIPLKLLRLEAEHGEALPAGELANIAEELLGAENLKEILESGISLDELGELLSWATGIYIGGEQKNPEAPAKVPGP